MSNRSIAASLRAVFDITVYRFPGVERFATVGTKGRAAIVANQCCTRTGRKLLTALSTVLDRSDDREWTVGGKFRMGRPELLLGYAVAYRAKGDQIVKAVRLTVVIEQAEWLNVMNRITFALRSAALASVVITLARRLALLMPVRPAIFRVPAAPEIVVAATDNPAGRPPVSKALTATKVVLNYCTRNFLKFRSAIRTRHDDALTPLSFAVLRLPSGIALETAERFFSQGDVIPPALDRFTALGAMHCNHTFHYTTSGLFHKGALCYG